MEPNILPYDAYSARCCCNGPLEAMKWLLLSLSLWNLFCHPHQVQPNIPPYDAYGARRCCNGPLEAMEWLPKQSPENSKILNATPVNLRFFS